MIYDVTLAFFALLGLHMLADYPLQGDFMAKFKGSNKYIMFCHCMLYSFVLTSGLWLLGVPWHSLLFAGLTLLTTHFIIDSWKCNIQDKSKALTMDLYVDQGCHIVINMALLLFLR
jgi:hypothetical protein